MHNVPTDEQLRDAWRALAEPDWGTFEAVRLAHLRWSLVMQRARLIAGGHRVPPRELPPVYTRVPAEPLPLEAVRVPSSWGSLRVTHPDIAFDCKRAAAGERVDD